VTTAYTRQELDELKRSMLERVPALPTVADFKTAQRVNAITMAGSDRGILLNLEISRGATVMLQLNPVVALVLFTNIHAAAKTGNWWKTELKYRRSGTLRIPNTDDAKTAANVISLTTGAAGQGMLVNLGGAHASYMIYLPRKIAGELLLGIRMSAEQAGWWGEDFVLKPCAVPK
jgi:hypothetical protein